MPWWWKAPTMRARVILVGVSLLGVGVLFIQAWTALVPFFLGAIMAYLFLPIVDFLERRAPRWLRQRRAARPLAILLVYIAVIAMVAGALSGFVPTVIGQFRSLAATFPRLWQSAQNSFTVAEITAFLDTIPPEIRTPIMANLEKAGGTVLQAVEAGIVVTVTTLSQTISFILGMVIVPIWLFYIMNDILEIKRTVYHAIPEAWRADVRNVVHIVNDMLSAYLRVQLTLCILVGIMSLIALMVIGVDLAVLLATFAGVFEVIPVLGPYLGAIPALLVAVFDAPIKALWVAISFFAIQQIENTFLVPRIAGQAVRLHPAVVMVVMVVASQLAGLWGLLLAVPVTALVRDVYRYLYLRTLECGATPEQAMTILRREIEECVR